MSCSDSWCIKLVREVRVSSFRDLQFVLVIGSRVLEGEAAKGRIGFGVTSEIYLLERMLRVGAAMLTSELR